MLFNSLDERKRFKVYYVYKVISVPPTYASVIFDFIAFFWYPQKTPFLSHFFTPQKPRV
jgi:hypothetical protein